MKKKINIAIDGFSSCGKSTLAKALSKELNYVYIDTGAMYRATTLYALQNNLLKNGTVDENDLKLLLDSLYVNFKYNSDSGQSETYLNGQNVEKEIRSMQVSNHVSTISKSNSVRDKMVKLQRRMAESKGIVMDGRDIGTVVLPEAEIKFFLTADAQVRAQRRYEELIGNGSEVRFEDVLDNINMRDEKDSSREIAPLKKAANAIVIDNSDLTIEEQFNFMLNHVQKLVTETNGEESVTA